MINEINDSERRSAGRVAAFLWQHLWLAISLFIMTFGVALCVRSALGSSVISTIPFVMSLAGGAGKAQAWTIGEYTYIMNVVLVLLQIVVLRRRFEAVQLFQLVIGFFFGALLDVNMWLTDFLVTSDSLLTRVALQLGGCVVLAVGISLEIRCGSVTMPGEGLPAAISRATGHPFAKIKIMVDIALVAIAVLLGYLFFGSWMWQVVGPGTLVAMILVGWLVKIINPHLEGFTRILDFGGALPRHIFGLLRFIRHNDRK